MPFKSLTRVHCVSRAVAGSAAIIAIGCGSLVTTSERASMVRGRLVGIPARELQQCLGAPDQTQEFGEIELALYSRRWEPESGISKSVPFYTPTRSGQPVPEGRCVYAFQLREGCIESIDALGRDAGGLNINERCLAQLSTCFGRWLLD